MKKTLIGFLFFYLGLSMTAFATPKWYKIEVLAYSNKDVRLIAPNEKLPEFPAIASQQELLPSEHHLFYKPFELLPQRALTLLPQMENIAKDPKKQLILYYAWLQEIPENNSSTPIHFYAQDLTAKTTHPLHEEPQYDTNKPWALDGFITIKRGEKFDLSSYLYFNVLVDQNKKTYWPWQKREVYTYPLYQTQTIEPNQVFTIEKPEFGLMIKISPFA